MSHANNHPLTTFEDIPAGKLSSDFHNFTTANDFVKWLIKTDTQQK